MIGIIYGNTIQAAEEKLDQMIIDWTHLNEQMTKITRTAGGGSTVMLNDKDTWRTVVANSGSCGYCCNVALIDKNIPQEIIEQVIMPCVTRRPWTAIGYY